MKKILLLSLLLITVIGCQGKKGIKTMEKPTSIELEFGKSFESILKSYPMLKVDKHPAGVNFYTLNWPEKKPTEILFKQGEYSIDIPFAINIMLFEDTDRIPEGLTLINLDAGITFAKKISHDEARLKFHDFLRSLLNKGWKRTISFSDPRLSGSQAAHYMRENENFYSLDPDYLPTLKEWMAVDKLTSMFWGLQADNKAFMNIDLQRKFDKINPDLGVYLLSISIENDQEMGLSHFSPEEKKDWYTLKKWEAVKSNLLKIRTKREKDLLSKGYKIDESYEDYEINPKKEP